MTQFLRLATKSFDLRDSYQNDLEQRTHSIERFYELVSMFEAATYQCHHRFQQNGIGDENCDIDMFMSTMGNRTTVC